ncbi:hypothetical protein BRD04_06790 [Halobacteriales archaeon QS_9_67_17]|nr:MAG: hypothetical protein BRD04_06790 [Halobacteriales archaeon QS_9_67_17]
MVGLSGTAKKLQTLATTAEKLFERLNALRERVEEMNERMNDTHDRVAALEHEIEEQRALVEALAVEQGIDVEAVLAEAAIDEAEGDAKGVETKGDTNADAGAEGDGEA